MGGAQDRELSLLQAVLDATSDGVLVVDLDGNVTATNRRFAELWRLPDELIRAGDDSALLAFVVDQLEEPGAFLEKVQELYSQPLAESSDVLRFKDGRIFERSSAPHLLDGEPIGRVWSFHDVSSSEHALERVARAEAEYRSLVDRLPAVVYSAVFGVAGEWLYISPHVEQVLGYTAKEWREHPELWGQRIHPGDRDRVWEEERSVEQTGQKLVSEYRLLHRDGHVVWVRDEGQLVPGEDGQPATIRGLMFDVTELKEAEEEARASRDLLAAVGRAQSGHIGEADTEEVFGGLLGTLLEATGSEYGFIGEVLHDPDGSPYLRTFAITDIAWNEATKALYERAAPAMEFRHLETLFGAVITSGQPVIANNAPHDARRGGLPDGHPALNAFLGVPLRHAGELVGMAGLANRPGGYDDALIDVIEPILITGAALITATRNRLGRREAEEELREREQEVAALLQRLIRAQEDERTRIAADIHDDSIQAVTAVGLRVDLLRDQLSGPEEIKAADELSDSISSAIARLRRLLFELRPRTLDEDGLCAALQVYLRMLHEETGINTTLDAHLDAEPDEVSRLILYRVAQEALVNARKHAQAARLNVDVLSTDGGVQITIRDDGAGLDPAAADRDRPGHLGLRFMRERVERAGGWLRLTSEPDWPTVVMFWIPVSTSRRGAAVNAG